MPKCTIVLQKKSKSIFTVEVNARKHQITAIVVPFCNTRQTIHRCKYRNWMLVEEMSINSIIEMTLYCKYFPVSIKKSSLQLTKNFYPLMFLLTNVLTTLTYQGCRIWGVREGEVSAPQYFVRYINPI